MRVPDLKKMTPEAIQQMVDELIAENESLRRALEAREDQASLFNSIRDAILVADSDRNIIDCNQTFTEMFGYSLPQIKGKKTHTLYEKYEEYLKMGEEIRKNIGSAKFVYTINYKKKSGEIFPGETNTFYLVNSKKEIIGFIGMIRDVTEQKQAEKEQKQLQTQLAQAQKMESVGRLAGGVAHDFNNMLTIINGYAEMMADVLPSSDPMYESVQEIQDAGRRSAVIVRKLLAFARKQTITPVPMNLNDSVSDMLQMLQRLIEENIDLLWKPCQDAWLIKMDFSQIEQILANIVVNSRDAIADTGKITIETQNVELDDEYCATHKGFVAGQFVMIAVSDNGCGMDKHVLENLFEPFFTTKEIGKGTGLGLPTVYGIVKQNNGFINVYSEPGQGTTVRIYFPRFSEETDVKEQEKKKDILLKGRGETILVLEDETVVLNLTRIMLEKLGYTVLAANRPGEAMKLAGEHGGKIDMLITDVVMPEMNGREFAKQLNDLYPQIKALFMSGYTAEVIASHGILEEGFHFIEKPFSIDTLAVRVAKVLSEISGGNN